MLVTRFNPRREVRDFRTSFDLFNSLLDSVERREVSEDDSISGFVPTINTREGESAYHIEVDLPGIKKEEIDIQIEENLLTISGERKVREEVNEEEYHKVESRFGKFSRSFTLPKEIDTENIHAESMDGVLEVVIPKLQIITEKPKKIQIK
jgi:HSP20 family protein